MNAQAERVWPIFVGVWILLTILSYGFHFFCRNAPLKRRVHVPAVIFVCSLFLTFVWLMGFGLIPAAPPVILLAILMIRNARYCDACGATQFFQGPFSPPQCCERCGATLSSTK